MALAVRLKMAGLPVRPACPDCAGVLEVIRGDGLFARCVECRRARRIASIVTELAQGNPHVFVYLAEGPRWAA